MKTLVEVLPTPDAETVRRILALLPLPSEEEAA